MLDVNSLYPSVMFEKDLPYGEPVFFEGKYKPDSIYELYIQQFSCSFKLKEGKIPTIQIKNSFRFIGNEYLESSEGEIVTLTLTNVDLKLFLENYEVSFLEYHCGWKFKNIQNLFKEYIDKWIKVKIKSTKEKNKGMRTLAKLMLNSLYGKFATSLNVKSKIPYLDEEGIVKYKFSEEEQKDGIYLPVACFITAYAREKTIRTSQAIKDYSIKKYGTDLYYYSDTDSIHTGLSIEELEKFCDIDDVRLGAWKCEGNFVKAKFIRQKCYLEAFYKQEKYFGKIDKLTKKTKPLKIKPRKHFLEIKITCAGMPSSCYKYVTWQNFKTGFSCGGKLTFKHVKGGVKLVETDFTIKEEKIKKEIKKF